jgi:enolase
MGVMPCESRGEDEDIADYCVGLGTECVREMAILNNGANRFLEIEDELGSKAKFWGKRGLKGRKFQE